MADISFKSASAPTVTNNSSWFVFDPNVDMTGLDGALLVVAVSWGNTSINLTSVRCQSNSQSGEIIYTDSTASGIGIAMFTFNHANLINGAWGQIRGNFSSSGASFVVVTFGAYNNVAQTPTSGVEAYAYNDNSGDPLNVSVTTSKAGSWLVGMHEGNGSSATEGAGTIVRASSGNRYFLDSNGTVSVGSNALEVDARSDSSKVGHISALVLAPLLGNPFETGGAPSLTFF